MNEIETDIGQLEKALNALIRRPQLIRRDHSQIGCLLGRPDLLAQDRQRLGALLDTPLAECSVPVRARAIMSGERVYGAFGNHHV